MLAWELIFSYYIRIMYLKLRNQISFQKIYPRTKHVGILKKSNRVIYKTLIELHEYFMMNKL